MKSNFKKIAAAGALALALSAGLVGASTVDDGAADGLRKVQKAGNELSSGLANGLRANGL
jgi:hypothetical protein